MVDIIYWASKGRRTKVGGHERYIVARKKEDEGR